MEPAQTENQDQKLQIVNEEGVKNKEITEHVKGSSKSTTNSKSKSKDKSKSRSKSRKSKSPTKKKHRKHKKSRSRSKDRKHKKRHHKRHSRSRSYSYSRSRSRSGGKSRKHKKDRKEKERRREKKSRRYSRSRSKSSDVREQNYGKFAQHYQGQIKKSGKGIVAQQQKHENSGLYWDGFHWISPEVQDNKVIRSVTIYGLPFDKCKFTTEQFVQFLTVYMAENKICDTGNEYPISNCTVDEQTTIAEVEFSSIEECQRFSLIGTINILGKECRIVKKHDSNPYKQQQGIMEAQELGRAQALAMQAMNAVKQDMLDQKKGIIKVEGADNFTLPIGQNGQAALKPLPSIMTGQPQIPNLLNPSGPIVPNLLTFNPNLPPQTLQPKVEQFK